MSHYFHISVVGKSDISKDIENKSKNITSISPKISHILVKYKNADFGCCEMDWKSRNILNGRR